MFRKIGEAIDKSAHMDSKRSFVSGGITSAIVIALGLGMWTLYPKDGPVAQGDNASAPVIYADATPYKTIPDDPGGMDIPHRESRVFEVLKQEGTQDIPEKTAAVLPETEEAMERAEIFARIEEKIEKETGAPENARIVAAPKEEHEVIKPQIPEEVLAKIEKGEIEINKGQLATTEQKKGIENLAAHKEDGKESVASKPIRISVNGGDGSKKEIVINEKQNVDLAEDNQFDSFEPEQDAEMMALAKKIVASGQDDASSMAANTEPAAGAVKAEAVNVAAKHFVQLGSVQSEDASAKEWDRLQRAYDDILTGLDYRVQRADLGERGIYYRIQGGPLTEHQARSICDKITAQKPGGCLVINP